MFNRARVTLIILFLISFWLVLILTPSVAWAKIVPDCGTGGCSLCQIFQLVKNLLDFAWKWFAIPFSVLMLAYGGFLMLAPSVGGEKSVAMYERGKKVLTNTVIGIIIIFFAWLIVDTIIKVVANQMIGGGGVGQIGGLGPWNNIQCKEAETSDSGRTSSGYTPSGGAPPAYSGGRPISGTMSHNDAKSKLAENGIGIGSTGNCESKASNCTNLDGIKESAVNDLIKFNEACGGCVKEVRGGTEPGHQINGPHSQGRAVDVLKNDQAMDFIRNSKDLSKDYNISQVCASDYSYNCSASEPGSIFHLTFR